MKVILLDDEVYCTDVLHILIKKYCPDIEVIGVYHHALEALEAIRVSPPDLLFLDIEMPQMNGFDLLTKLGSLDFKVIFTTAYDQYALKAFKFNTIDYLLKPIDKDELISALKKCVSGGRHLVEKLNYVQYLRQNHVPERIMLPIGQELILVYVKNIVCCEADGSYCKVYCTEIEKPYLLSKNLREMEELLNNPQFFRPHASWLINTHYISKIIKSEGTEIVLHGNKHIPVARGKKQEVLDRLMK